MDVDNFETVWPEWKIIELIGEGAYGKVYKAVREDHGISAYSAIKAIAIPQNDAETESLRLEGLDEAATKTYFEEIVKDFINEIKLMVSLKGTQNIVSVEDYKVVEKNGKIGWDIYIRMELLTSFNNYICDKKLTEKDVIKLGLDICSALELCAQRGIIHRDIKPENIFISDFGYFKLGDFGIGRQFEKTVSVRTRKGTLNYMAPEVNNGSHYDSRADIYSLGIVLYKLLNNNRIPFLDPYKQIVQYGDRVKAVEKRMDGEPLLPPVQASTELAAVILKACAFKPEDRFENPTQFKSALESTKLQADSIPQSGCIEDISTPTGNLLAGNENTDIQDIIKTPVKGKNSKPGRKTKLVLSTVVFTIVCITGIYAFASPKPEVSTKISTPGTTQSMIQSITHSSSDAADPATSTASSKSEPETTSSSIKLKIMWEDSKNRAPGEKDLYLFEGDKADLYVTVDGQKSNSKKLSVEWTSSDNMIADVDNNSGSITAGYSEKAVITCRLKENPEIQAACTVVVVTPVTSIKLNTSSIPNWTVGKSGKFKTTILPADAINKAVVWKSSDPSIVSVTSTGIVVAKKPGQVIITCYSKYNSKVKATCKIVVLATSASNVVSYTQDKATGLFYADQDNAWQRKYGFNRLYDWGNPITAMYYNTVRIKFNYGGIDWMVQLWKGQYGYAFIGCEIGVYTKPTTRTTDHYDCADDNHRLMMTMTMYQKDKFKFTRPYQSYWWATGFIPGSLPQYADRTELTMVARLDMYDTAMLKAFVKAIADSGFTYGKTAGKATPDTFTIRGKSIYFNWKNLGQPSINSKVTFYSNGGTDIATMRGTAGEKLVAPADPIKDGYVFLGWDPALPSTYPVEALKTYAKWGTTIDFNSDGGTSVASVSGQVGSTIAYPANPTKNGYVFIGWEPVLPEKFPLENLTVKARWEAVITTDTSSETTITESKPDE